MIVTCQLQRLSGCQVTFSTTSAVHVEEWEDWLLLRSVVLTLVAHKSETPGLSLSNYQNWFGNETKVVPQQP